MGLVAALGRATRRSAFSEETAGQHAERVIAKEPSDVSAFGSGKQMRGPIADRSSAEFYGDCELGACAQNAHFPPSTPDHGPQSLLSALEQRRNPRRRTTV